LDFSNPPDASTSIRVVILAATPDDALLLFSEALRFGAVADFQLVNDPSEVAAVVKARWHDLAVGLWQRANLASAAAVAALQESGQIIRSLVFINYGGAVLLAITRAEDFTIAGDCDRLVMRLDQALRMLANKASLPEEGLPNARWNRASVVVAESRESAGAHELNELLTVIAGSGEVLLKRFVRDLSSVHYLEQILAAAKRAGLVVAGLIPAREPGFGPIDVGSTLPAIRGLLRRVAGADLSVSIRMDSDPMTAAIDRRWLESLASVIVAHARLSLPDGSLLEISLERIHFEVGTAPYPSLSVGQYVIIQFNYIPHGLRIQDPSRTLPPAPATKKTAAEMGLSSVYTLVSEVRGVLAVESTSGGISAMTIFLPLLYVVPHY